MKDGQQDGIGFHGKVGWPPSIFMKGIKRGSKFAKLLRYVYMIPAGKVATYGDVAYMAGFPGDARQVAWAMNHDLMRCPWPRVVGKGGKILLTGEKGFTQRTTLESEGVEFIGLRVNMEKHRFNFFEAEKKARA